MRCKAIFHCLLLGLISGLVLTSYGGVQEQPNEQQYAERTRELRQAAEQGDAEAQFRLGLAYKKPPVEAEDILTRILGAEQAKRIIALAGKAKDPASDEDNVKAAEWFRRAAEQGHAEAQYHLGDAYYFGHGVQQDDAEAVRWYRQAAEQRHANAQLNLGYAYAHGEGIAENRTEAIRWYRLAAEQDNAEAQFNLGLVYDHARGVQRDLEEAVKWYLLAAAQEHVRAQYTLGNAYAHGDGVPKNHGEAVRWYRLAAEQGHLRAQNFLGEAYAQGQGIGVDLVQAYAWYNLAAARGDESAAVNRSVLAAKMTPGQLEAGEKLSQKYAEKYIK